LFCSVTRRVETRLAVARTFGIERADVAVSRRIGTCTSVIVHSGIVPTRRGRPNFSRLLQDEQNWMLTSSQFGSHEIITVESGLGIAGDLNCMSDEDQIRRRLGQIWQEGTASCWGNFTRLTNG